MAKSQTQPKWQRYLIALTATVISCVVLLALYWGRPILIPIATATLLTLLLSPVVNRVVRAGVPRVAAVLSVVTVTSIILTSLGWLIAGQISEMLAELPRNTETIKRKIRAVKQYFGGPTARQFGSMVNEIQQELAPDSSSDKTEPSGNATPPGESPSRDGDRVTDDSPSAPSSEDRASNDADQDIPWTSITGYLGSAMEALGAIAFAMVLIVFFLLDGHELRDRLVVLAGRARLSVTSRALEDISDRITRYLGMVAIVNGGFGLILGTALYFLGMPYAALWGIVAGAMRFIPYVGPWVGAVFPIAMSLALSSSWWQPLAVLACVLVLELVTNNVVEPLVFGRTAGVSPTALIISAAFWLYMWGPLGLVLSIPIAVCLLVIGKHIPELHVFTLILGDEPALEGDISFYQRLMLGDAKEAIALVDRELQSNPGKDIYNDVLVPTLAFTKYDYQRDRLKPEDRRTIIGLLRDTLTPIQDLVAEYSQLKQDVPSNQPPQRRSLVVCAAADQFDRLGIQILSARLDSTAWDYHPIVAGTSSRRTARKVAEHHPDAICIVSIAPGGLPRARNLCRRLREAFPDTEIVVGRWGQDPHERNDREQLLLVGASRVTSTLADTLQMLHESSDMPPTTPVAATPAPMPSAAT